MASERDGLSVVSTSPHQHTIGSIAVDCALSSGQGDAPCIVQIVGSHLAGIVFLRMEHEQIVCGEARGLDC